jgi:catechol 2,3-dioxygenase-like lactoylglutathione lyase family enzyme
MIPKSLSHVALGVRDYERSLHFYRDLLGFHAAQEVTEFGGTQYDGGISERSGRKYRIAVLRYGRETSAPYGMSEEAPVIDLIAPLGSPPTGSAIKADQIRISHFGV